MRLMLRTVLLGVLVLGVGLLLSCQKEDDDNPSGPSDQGSEYGDPPSAPSNPSPSDNTDGVATTTDLSWSCSDPDQDPLTYDVYFGTSSNPSRVSTGQSASTYDPGTLDYEETYYWKVIAKDDHSHETSSAVWSFTVAGEGNQPPTAPASPNPANNATAVATTTGLSWSCSDPDQDPLTYDVYFGTSSNPSRVSTGQSASTYDPGTLDYEETYYWKVVAKDDHSHETSSAVWSFTVAGEGNQPPTAPASPNPANNATGVATTTDLSWSCSDPDQDPLTYDVYFGTSMSPPLVSSDQYQESYDPGELETETDYYWQIVAKDDHDDETTGPVWSFTTEDGGGGDIIEQDFELGDTGEMITMIWIPAGDFQMGAYDGEEDAYDSERPQHPVTISQGFWMGKYEVTQAQWEAVVGENPAHDYGVGDDHPVYYVSWNDIHDDYLPAINATEDGNPWRLPSEAEWEYACRAGTTTRFYWGDDPNYTDIDDYAVYRDNDPGGVAEVGTKFPNAWGLYDMSGNLYEWCEDWYHYSYDGAPTDGSAWNSPPGESRVLRGGSWHYDGGCRSAGRGRYHPGNRGDYYGFRVVRSSP